MRRLALRLLIVVALPSCAKAPSSSRPEAGTSASRLDAGPAASGDAGAMCASGAAAIPTTGWFDCTTSADCALSCDYGAINAGWAARVDGASCVSLRCVSTITGAPQCQAGRCVAIYETGAPQPECTGIPPPLTWCDPAPDAAVPPPPPPRRATTTAPF